MNLWFLNIFLIYYPYCLRIVRIFVRIFGEQIFKYLFSKMYVPLQECKLEHWLFEKAWNKKNIPLGTEYTFVVHFWLLEITSGTA